MSFSGRTVWLRISVYKIGSLYLDRASVFFGIVALRCSLRTGSTITQGIVNLSNSAVLAGIRQGIWSASQNVADTIAI